MVIILTEKLYDYDAYLWEFTAQVISCTPCENGYKVILDKTAFFPEEGGQYSDKGTLNGYEVFDVQLENGEPIHYCREAVSGIVTGKIDFDRRFRNMQNHTGEHIISGLVHSLFGSENVGFHLGEDEVTCDYDIELDAQQLELIELNANKAVYKNLSVKGYYPEADRLKEISYRSKKEIEEAVRIVEIDGVDCCACCAPHVKNTGEIGVIKIISYMRLRGGCRLFIACGLDAFMDYSLKHNEIKAISALLASKPEECSGNVQKISDSLKKAAREINFLKGKILENAVKELKICNSGMLIFTDKLDMTTLRNIVNLAKDKAPCLCGAFSGNDTDGYSYIIYSEDYDVSEKSKDINEKLSGRGGGKNNMIQGSVSAQRKAIEDYFSSSESFTLNKSFVDL